TAPSSCKGNTTEQLRSPPTSSSLAETDMSPQLPSEVTQKLAETMDTAALEASTVPMLTLETDFGEADAYAIQAASIARREARGDQVVGMKLGLTSKA